MRRCAPQFESPRYAAIAVANQEGQKIPDIYKQDPYKVMDDIIDRWFAAAAAERAEKALDITPTPELEPSLPSRIRACVCYFCYFFDPPFDFPRESPNFCLLL